MALSTSTSTANPELDSTSFKSISIKEAELFAVQQAQINYIYANLANNSILNYNIYKAPEYLEFYERRISPNQVNKIAYDLTRTGVASANEARQLCADLTGTKNRQKYIKKKSQNCSVSLWKIRRELRFGGSPFLNRSHRSNPIKRRVQRS